LATDRPQFRRGRWPLWAGALLACAAWWIDGGTTSEEAPAIRGARESFTRLAARALAEVAPSQREDVLARFVADLPDLARADLRRAGAPAEDTTGTAAPAFASSTTSAPVPDLRPANPAAEIVFTWRAQPTPTRWSTWRLLLGASAGALIAIGAFGRRRTREDLQLVEAEVRDRTLELRQQARAREQGLASLAHELRTPLTTILASVDMLRDGYAEDPADARAFMDQASAAGHHLLFLVNDLLDCAAHDAGALRIDTTDLEVGDLFAQVAQILGPAAEAKGTSLMLDRDGARGLRVHADAHRFLQVAFNLVGNAIKYSPPGSDVRVRAFLGAGATDTAVAPIRFEIVDDGIGVPPERRAELFERYARVHDASKSSAAGTGLGLFITKALVEKMGGAIGYRAGDGGGSVFWFELPAARRHTPARPAGLAATATPQSGEDRA
jgi:signal transduction histidine kinase